MQGCGTFNMARGFAVQGLRELPLMRADVPAGLDPEFLKLSVFKSEISWMTGFRAMPEPAACLGSQVCNLASHAVFSYPVPRRQIEDCLLDSLQLRI